MDRNNYWEERSSNFNNDIRSVLFKRFPDLLNHHIHNWHEQIVLSNIPNKDNLNILDIGCGYGRITIPLIRRNDKIEVTGIDISENFIKQYKKNTGQDGIVSSIEELPDAFGSYDYIICITVLMYMEKTILDKTIFNILSHLKKNGEIILIEPLNSGRIFSSCFGLLNILNKNKIDHHETSFNSNELKKIIMQNGGVVTNEKRLPFTTFFIIPIYLLSLIFTNKLMSFVLKFICKCDRLLENHKLPSLYISYLIKLKK